MPSPLLPIETDRLLLRAFTADDAERYFSYRSLPETVRYLYRDPKTYERAVESAAKSARLDFAEDGDILALADPAQGRQRTGG